MTSKSGLERQHESEHDCANQARGRTYSDGTTVT
jgi:hypothetical protein